MNQRTRYFLIASALIIAAVFGTGLVAYYSGGRAANAALPELAYVPANATAVAYADVRTIMNSQLRQRLQQHMQVGADRDRLEAEIGLNIERDIDSVVAGYTGDSSSEGGIVIARGRFDDDMIETKAVQHGATVETYKGKRLILFTRPEGDMPRDEAGAAAMARIPVVAGIAVLDAGVMAFGDAATLRRAIDAAADKTGVTTNADLMRQINDMQGTGNAWFVTKFDSVSAHAALPSEVKTHLPQLQWVAASANVNGGLTGLVKAEARDDKAATDLQAVISGGLAAARMVGGQDQSIEAVINSVQVMGAGNKVSVTFALSPELIDKLTNMVHPQGR